MIDRVRQEIRLSRRMPDGAAYRDHLRAAEAAGVDTGELDPAPIPPGSDEILSVFWRLRRIAGSNGIAPNSISFSEVKAWQELNRVELTPFEVDLIFLLDEAAIVAFAEGQ